MLSSRAMTELPAHLTTTYRTVEMHTGGEPVRLVLEGFPEPHGATVLEKRHDAVGTARPPPPPSHVGASRPRRDVWRTSGSGRPARRVWRAVHAPLRLQHDVRPRHDRSRPLGRRVRSRPAARRHAPTSSWNAPAVRSRCMSRTAAPVSPSTASRRSPPRSTPKSSFPASAGSSATSAMAVRSTPSCRPRASASISRASPVGQLRAAALAIMRAIRARGEVRHPTEPDLSFLYSAILTDDTPPASPRPTPPSLRVRRGPDRPQRHRQRRHRAYGGRCRARPDRARRNPRIRRRLRRAVPRRAAGRGTRSGRIAPGASASPAPRRSAAPRPGSSRTGDRLGDGFAIEDATPLPIMA